MSRVWNNFKLTRMVEVASEMPAPLLNKSVGLVITGLIKIRQSLEEQPHTSFKVEKKISRVSKENHALQVGMGEVPKTVAPVVPPPFRPSILSK